MSRIKKVLVAYDGSPHSKEGLDWAIDLSLLTGAKVVAVKVFEGGQLYVAAEMGAAKFMEKLEKMREDDQKMMAEIVAAGESRGVEVTGVLLQGNIAAEIIAYAKDNLVDLIVVGTKGHGLLEELLMGSVARNLISLAHIPVLVVKD